MDSTNSMYQLIECSGSFDDMAITLPSTVASQDSQKSSNIDSAVPNLIASGLISKADREIN